MRLQSDLVLMDVALPDGSGLEALRQTVARLVISENTVKVHVRNNREKLELKTRSQAASFARRSGFASSAWPSPASGA